MATENFLTEQKGRRSKRRSSILKTAKARPFDDIQNTPLDRHRRVSFSSKIQVKEFRKSGRGGDQSNHEQEPQKKASIQISTPKADHSRHNRLSIDRLSIIPKFERSFVIEDSGDDCDFEPYCDESSPAESGSVKPVVAAVPSSVTEHASATEHSASVISQAGNEGGCQQVANSSTGVKMTLNQTDPAAEDMAMTLIQTRPPSVNSGPDGSIHISEDMAMTLNQTRPASANSGPDGSIHASEDMAMTLNQTRHNSGADGSIHVNEDMAITLNQTRPASANSGPGSSIYINEDMAMTLNQTRHVSVEPGMDMCTSLDQGSPANITHSETMASTLNQTGTVLGNSNTEAMAITLCKTRNENFTEVLGNKSEVMILTPIQTNSTTIVTHGKTASFSAHEGHRMEGDENMTMTLNKTVHNISSDEDGMHCSASAPAGPTSHSLHDDEDDCMIITPNKTAADMSISACEGGDSSMARTFNTTMLPEPDDGAEEMELTLPRADDTNVSVVEMVMESSMDCDSGTKVQMAGLDRTYVVEEERDVEAASGTVPPVERSPSASISAGRAKDIRAAITVPAASPKPPAGSTDAPAVDPPAITKTAPSPKRTRTLASKSPTSAARKQGRPPLNPSARKTRPQARLEVVTEDEKLPMRRQEDQGASPQQPKGKMVTPLHQGSTRKRGRPPKSDHVLQSTLPKRVAVSTPLTKRADAAPVRTPVWSAGLNLRVTRSTSKLRDSFAVRPVGDQSCEMELTTVEGAHKPCTPAHGGNKTVSTPAAMIMDHSHHQATGGVVTDPRGADTTSSNPSSDQFTSVSTLSSNPTSTFELAPGASSQASGRVTDSSQILVNGVVVPRDEGNWLQNQDSNFVLVDSSGDSSSSVCGLAEATAIVDRTRTSQRTPKQQSPTTLPSPTTGVHRRRRSAQSRDPPMASILQKLKGMARAPVESQIEIETPEKVAIAPHQADVTAQESIFPSPEITMIMDDKFKNRQSLMMSPAAFKRFVEKMEEERSVAEERSSAEEAVPGACVEVSARGGDAVDKSVISQSECQARRAEESELQPPLDPSSSSGASQPRPSPSLPAEDLQDHSHRGLMDKGSKSLLSHTSPSSSPGKSKCRSPGRSKSVLAEPRFQLAQALLTQLHSKSQSSFSPPSQPHETQPRPSPTLSSSPHKAPQTSVNARQPAVADSVSQSMNTSQLQESQPHPSPNQSRPVATVTPQPQAPSQRTSSAESAMSKSPSPLERMSTSPESESVFSRASSPVIPFQTHVADSTDFIMHVHALRTRYLAIALACQIRLSCPDYLHSGRLDFKPILESIYTRANIGISALTLFVSYGGLSGLARAKGPLPIAEEMPITEVTAMQKLVWLEKMHDEIEQKHSDIEVTMVHAADLFHWQLDLWNQSKVDITIHNSAKVSIVLEECPLSTYPQKIKRIFVKHTRGGLLSSKPNTSKCQCTADIAQLLWTMIGGKS